MTTLTPAERRLSASLGYPMAMLGIAGVGVLIALLATRTVASALGVALFALVLLGCIAVFAGLYMLQPNQAAICTLYT